MKLAWPEGVKEIPHQADLKIKIIAPTLEGLFEKAVSAMASLAAEEIGNDFKEERVEIEGEDPNILLVDLLNEIIGRMQANHLAYPWLEIIRLDNKGLEAKIKGGPTAEFREDFKAATHHGLEIRRVGDKFQAEIIFDV